MERSEYDLVCDASNGNIEAFGYLYSRYYSSMTAIVFSMTGHIETAEDIVQEAFVIACRDIGRLRYPDKFAAWLAGICRNITRKFLRSNRAKSLPDNYMCLQDNDETKTDIEIQAIVRQAVWSLPQKLREVIILRYYDELSYEQIAKMLGLTVQGVNGRIFRAKKKIVKDWKKRGLYYEIL